MEQTFLLQDFIRLNASRHPEKEALVFQNQRWSHQEVDIISDEIALCLKEQFKVKRQDRVLVYAENCAETIFAVYGILKAGCIFIIINTAVKATKLAYILEDSGPAVVFVSKVDQEVIHSSCSELKEKPGIIWMDESPGSGQISLNRLLGKLKSPAELKSQLAPYDQRVIDRDIAALIYTSGSTGEPKGVISTHHNMISAAKSIVIYLENKPDDRVLNSLPLSFDYGLYQALMTLIYGGTLILEKNFIFLSDILNLVKRENVTGLPIVPMMLAMLIENIDIRKYDLSTLRYVTNTGAALPLEHIRQLRQLVPDVQIYSMFGLTECKRVSYLPPRDIDRKPDSVGVPMPNCEVSIVDENNVPVKSGETGELVIRGSNVMQGYWNAPELTDKVFRRRNLSDERVLYSGDYFRQDDEGYLYFMGRRDDMIKSRGERISAKEVERVLYKIDGVLECVVIAVPEKMIGNALKAYLVTSRDFNQTVRDIQSHCSKFLENYAIPKYIEYVEELPKSAHGKIDKKVL